MGEQPASEDPGEPLGEPPASEDHVDRARAQWAQAWPELDTSPFAVVGRLGRAVAHLDRELDEFFQRHGLTRAHWDVLACLRRAGAPYRLSPTALYQGLMRSSATMTHRLRQLEDAGLVERVADPADRRALLVALTLDGVRLVDELAAAHLDNERRLLGALDPRQQEQLAGLLRELLVGLEAADRPGRGRRHRGSARTP
ncbi:MarR family winged helix-turn-helix transcriptional regulator [Rugosimonospora africana]|uniref:MarR family transcriptional regulator n=1 Tax=Rugosimonospora africana TaxID=556532 RepID=A0A8J3VT65_9ACTN|nr:MarR family transcriptional regulator [Rugosimonospora africana]GIH17321.1 MarR family transcriptional regulator [Rugosimonospora africana]